MPYFADQIAEPKVHHPYPLRSIHLNLTSACNLRCVYCYADDRESKPNNLTKLEHFDLLAELTQFGTSVVTFTGGGAYSPSGMAIHCQQS